LIIKTQLRESCYGLRLLLVIGLSFMVLTFSLVSHPAVLHISPSHFLPVQNTLSTDYPRLNLTYYTQSNLTEIVVFPNSMIAGDHVTLRAEWTSSLVDRTRLEVIASAIPTTLSIEEDTNVLELDTRALGNNATCVINSTAWMTNGSIVSSIFENVYIGNYFVPRVTVITPNGGEHWTGVNTIQWLAFDANADDVLYYNVRISSDSGSSFETVATSISQKFFEWNCSLYNKLDTYLVEIRATDGIYFAFDRSNSLFTAGEILVNITSTTTTENNTFPIDLRIAVFLVVLLTSSAIMALFVYYMSKKWF
jgi:hypothetical protein